MAIACAAIAASNVAVRHLRAPPTHPVSVLSSSAPWIYGRSDARFTIVEYADLECPYCREYFPMLQHWIDAHPEANWQWHHLPLSIHDPAATDEARLAECAGAIGGRESFWNSIDWIYRNTRGDGAGLPESAHLPEMSPAILACLESNRPDKVIRAQIQEATRDHISATPTVRLIDRTNGKAITLVGFVDEDAILSAIDLLTMPTNESAERTPNQLH